MTVRTAVAPPTRFRPFRVKWREVTTPVSLWQPVTMLAPTARSYMVTGLSILHEYQLEVRSKTFGPFLVRGRPL